MCVDKETERKEREEGEVRKRGAEMGVKGREKKL